MRIKNCKFIIILIYLIFSCVFLYSVYKPSRKIIVLDPGHAAKNSKGRIINYGCRSKSGTRELDLVLDIAERLSYKLIQNDMMVYFTRDKRHFWRHAESQNADNQDRAEFANSKNADIFLRIHCNWSVSSKCRGVSILWYKDDSKDLAEIVMGEIEKTGVIIDGIFKKELVGFRYAEKPSILIEFGYLSNEEDEKLLKDDEYIKKLSDAIVKGLKIYFEKKDEIVVEK